jgi:hypothetical protein
VQSFFAINRLSAYIDGELPDNEAAEVERAIAADAAVRDEYERMLSAVEFLRSRGPVQAPPNLHAAILAKVGDEPDPVAGFWARFLAPFRALPMEAVGVVFAVVAVVVLINQQPTPESALLERPPMAESVQSPDRNGNELPVIEPPQLDRRPDQPAPAPFEAGLPAKPIGSSSKSRPAQTINHSPEPAPGKSDRPLTAKRSSPVSEKHQAQKALITPQEAYVPEWERQGQDTTFGFRDPGTLYSPNATFFQLKLNDQHGLESLQKLVAKYGGSLKTLDGRSFTPRVLSIEDPPADLRVDIPAAKSDDFVRALNQLGLVTILESKEHSLFAGIVQLRIQVFYNP